MRKSLPEAMAVAAAEWRYLLASGMLWRIVGARLALAGAAVMLAWPGMMFEHEGGPGHVWSAFARVETIALSYIALGLGADLIGSSRRVRARDWAVQGDASPLGVILGRLGALGLTLAALQLTVLPIAALAYAPLSFPPARHLWALAIHLPHAAILGMIAIAYGSRADGQRAPRGSGSVVKANALFALGLVGALFWAAASEPSPRSWWALLNPFASATLLFAPGPSPAPPLETPALIGWLTATALAGAAAYALAARALGSSARKGSGP